MDEELKKQKHKEATIKWRENNKSKYLELQKSYNQKYQSSIDNYPELHRKGNQDYYKRNRDKILEKKREYYKKRMEQFKLA